MLSFSRPNPFSPYNQSIDRVWTSDFSWIFFRSDFAHWFPLFRAICRIAWTRFLAFSSFCRAILVSFCTHIAFIPFWFRMKIYCWYSQLCTELSRNEILSKTVTLWFYFRIDVDSRFKERNYSTFRQFSGWFHGKEIKCMQKPST